LATLNRNKRSVGLDLKDDRGLAAIRELVRDADAVVEGFRPGVVERLGIDYDVVTDVNPEVVYCSISGYGQVGPRSEQVGHDINYISMAGALDYTGELDGPPLSPGVPVADLGSSIFAALTIAAALQKEGSEYIDLAMADVAVNMASDNLAEMFGRGTAPGRGETLIGGAYPCYSVYECADGEYVSLAAVEPHFWKTFCEKMDRPEFVDKQWVRGDEREAMFDELTASFRTRTAEEWVEYLDSSEVPVSTVNTLDEVPEDEQVRHRELVADVEYDAAEKDTRTVTYPAVFEEYEPRVERAPDYGEHTSERLEGVGYDESEVESLREQGVVDG
jgi:crotonobetainyl-CoA:carnitine CoA-transferase CaiB-like acyl-CoA transferase